jgi:OmpA-OmpF porin, OOP family
MTRFHTRRAALLFAAAVLPASALSAQQATPASTSATAQTDVLTTVYGDAATEGPELRGIISARSGNMVQVTDEGGTHTMVAITDETDIRASGGFLGMGRKSLEAEALVNGLPVRIETLRAGERLLADEVRLKGSDLETARMIHGGTAQQFALHGAAIDRNEAATEALRGRVGDIDKYNVKGTANVYFDTGKWDLTPSARADLCAAARQADAMDNALLLVVGYTDSTGSYEVNQALSEKRAGRVVNYLQQQCGWKPWRMLTPTGMAEADPAASNSTAYGKAQNRRVSVNILVSKGLDGM